MCMCVCGRGENEGGLDFLSRRTAWMSSSEDDISTSPGLVPPHLTSFRWELGSEMGPCICKGSTLLSSLPPLAWAVSKTSK